MNGTVKRVRRPRGVERCTGGREEQILPPGHNDDDRTRRAAADAPSSSRAVTSRDQDSYDALAVSIERLLRIDISAPNITTQLAVSIDRIMLEEARAGELRLAWVRLPVTVSGVREGRR